MHSGEDSAVAVPDYVLFDFLETKGEGPAARWGHSAVVVDQKLFVYGGEGSHAYGDLQVFEPEEGQWHNVQTPGLNRPPMMNSHAACSVGSQMYLYGGRQGRKTLHGLYKFCAETMCWQHIENSSTTPPALAAHTMTAVGQHGILCFGGHGKKVYNNVHKLDPTTCLWEQFKTIGTPPSPRHGHTAVWDTSDSLIVFGGVNSTSQCLADVHVLSLSTGFWSSPQCTGDIPRARANHAAVMWGPNLMLVFGGCDPKAAGRFMNDVFVLDTVTLTWHCLNVVGTPAAPRYWHSMVSLQGMAVVYGGSNATQTFDRLFSISTDWTRDLESVANELQRMSVDSNGRLTAPSADRMRLQLDNMLEQRSAAEAFQAEVQRHRHTQGLLDAGCNQLRIAKSEISQLQLLQDEQRAQHQRQKALWGEELGRLRQALHHSERNLRLVRNDAEEARQLLKQSEEQCVALGNYKERFLVLTPQHDSLQTVCHQLHQDLGIARDELMNAQEAAKLPANQDIKSPKVLSMQANSSILDSCHDDDIRAHNARSQHIPVSQNEHHLASIRGFTEEDSGQDPLYVQQLAEQIVQLTLQRETFSACPAMVLYSLADTLQHALRNIQQLSREKASLELSHMKSMLKQMERKVEEYKVCPLCMEHDKDMMLNCGHQVCEKCGSTLTECPFCRAAVTMRLRVFTA
ncbi:hypothetical protein ABBQ32_003943 [Trebouxia sp. C0010 RCD-2024]